jgi:hypothetical protein
MPVIWYREVDKILKYIGNKTFINCYLWRKVYKSKPEENRILCQLAKKSLCPDDYGIKTRKSILNSQSILMVTLLELGITDGGSVRLVSPWRVNKCLETGGGHFENYL